MTTVIFISNDGKTRTECTGQKGDSLLKLAHDNGIDMEGACEGSMACSTCHVIVDPDCFDQLPKASEEEEDMLDITFGLTRTSRLACQIHIDDNLKSITVTLPAKIQNML